MPPAARPPELEGLIFRELSPSDLAQAVALEAAASHRPWTMDEVLEELSRPAGLCLGVFGGRDLLAMILGWIVQPEVHVNNLCVHPAVRRQGLGRGLMIEALSLSRLSGAHRCLLEVRVGNSPAEALYRGLGFVRAGTRPAYYHDGSDAALLTLEIAPEESR